MEVVRVLFLLTLGVACCYGNVHTCNTGTNEDTTNNEACPTISGANKCKQPVFTEYTTTGFSAAQYGCGACSGVDSEAASKCTTCDNNAMTLDVACNVRVETDTYKCYSYAYADSKWSKGAESTCMKKKATTVVKCQQPGDAAGENDFTGLTGCGACSGDDETKCKTCDDKALCNSSAVVSISVLLAGIAALLHLM